MNNSADVYLGNGDGTFQSAIEYPAGFAYPFFVTVGDFNGDGIADIVISTDFGTFSVLLGNGSGGFNAPIISTSTSSLGAMWAADLNHDGKLDLVAVNIANTASPSVAVLLGNGDGTFQPEADYSVPQGLFAVTVGDFNGDGVLDLASVSGYISGGLSVQPPGTLSYLFGKGDGTFSPAVNYLAPSGADAIAVGDFNSDGLLDVGVASDGGIVSSYVQTTLAVSTFGLNFPTQTLNTSSAPKPVKLTNNGAKSVAINSISITSPLYATDFSQTNNCGGGLAPRASCTIEVTFSPNASPYYLEPLTALLNISSTTPPQSVDLSGQETLISLSPSTLNFGTVAVGQTSAPITVTLTNLSTTVNVTLHGEKLVGANKSDFAQTSNCTQLLAANSSCTVSVTFTPSATGSRSAKMTPTSTTTYSPNPVSLSGTGQ